MYSVVGDRTVADREIRELADRGVFRLLRSPAQCVLIPERAHLLDRGRE